MFSGSQGRIFVFNAVSSAFLILDGLTYLQLHFQLSSLTIPHQNFLFSLLGFTLLFFLSPLYMSISCILRCCRIVQLSKLVVDMYDIVQWLVCFFLISFSN